MAKIHINTTAGSQEVELDASIYQKARDAGYFTLRAYMNNTFETKTQDGPAFDQACAQLGMMVGQDREYGINSKSLRSLTEGVEYDASGSIVRDAVPASRILFPAFIGSMVEDKLLQDRVSHVGVFNSMLALHDTIDNTRYEWPVANFSRPENARSRAIAQLSEPASMGTITLSDRSFLIEGTSIGLEISDEAMRAGSAASLDFVSLAVQRWMEVELGEKINDYLLAILQGDADAGYGPLQGAQTAQSFDDSINAAGELSQTAWIKWLLSGRRTRSVDWIITDIDGALAIQNRVGRPVITGDNGTSPRLNANEELAYPQLPQNPKIFITDDPRWPANTIVGFDSRYGIHKITSTILDYSASEAYAMRRSTKFRIDSGEAVKRLYDDAFQVMTLTV